MYILFKSGDLYQNYLLLRRRKDIKTILEEISCQTVTYIEKKDNIIDSNVKLLNELCPMLYQY